MENFQITSEKNDDYFLIRLSGYFNAEAASEFAAVISEALESGMCNFIADFEKCGSVNSPAVAQVLDSCIQIVEDHDGAFVIFGLNSLKRSFFEMAGIFQLAASASSLEEAVGIIRSAV